MSFYYKRATALISLLFFLGVLFSPAVSAQNSTADTTGGEQARFRYIQDGRFTDKLKIATYEWVPQGFNQKYRGIFVFVHGFTMHAQRYRRLAEILAANNFYGVAFDLHGFGRNFHTEKRPLIDGLSSKRRISYKKSFKSLKQITGDLKREYPDIPIYVVGESLGTALALQLASETELVNGLILSGPIMQLNPLLFAEPLTALESTVQVALSPHLNANLGHVINNYLSFDKEVRKDLREDKFLRKKITWIDILKTQAYVSKTLVYAAKVKGDPHILFLWGTRDVLLIPSDGILIYKLLNTKNKKMVRLKKRAHLITETKAIKPESVAAIFKWLDEVSGQKYFVQETDIKE